MSCHRFQIVFAGRFTCTVTFDPAIDADGKTGYVRPDKQWQPKPTDEEFWAFFPQYREWIHTVNLHIAVIINRDYRTIIYDRRAQPAVWEKWIYHPDGTKECVAQGKEVD